MKKKTMQLRYLGEIESKLERGAFWYFQQINVARCRLLMPNSDLTASTNMNGLKGVQEIN